MKSIDHSNIVCRFYSAGSCRFGASCRFLHSEAAAAAGGGDNASNETLAGEIAIPAGAAVCRYFEAGIIEHNCCTLIRIYFKLSHLGAPCPYGEGCFFRHEDTANVKSTAAEEREDQMCGICMDPVVKFGLLPGCDHVFCNSCVVNWRSQAERAENKSAKDSKRSCPFCREHSDFAIPSYNYFKGEEKARFIAGVLAERSSIQCKDYAKNNQCKFGGHCFYAHLDENGVDLKPSQLRV
jgi:E3 ubiquitin-protein ligase makorin